MKHAFSCLTTFVAALPLATASARADDPFTLTATGGGTTITASSNNVIDLAKNLIETEDQFAALSGKASNATLRYGGLEDAVRINRNAAGTSATSPSRPPASPARSPRRTRTRSRTRSRTSSRTRGPTSTPSSCAR